MLTETQKSIIESLARECPIYGPYELARRIARRQFNLTSNNEKCEGINASYYSILNVVRRYRQRRAA